MAGRYPERCLEGVGERMPPCPPQVALSQESFQGDLEPDLVAVLEAVGDCFFRAVDAEGDSTHLVDLYSFGKSIAREPEEAYRRIRETGRFRTLLDRHVNLMGHLRRQFMERQRRDEADYAFSDLESDRDEIGIFEGRQFGKTKKTAADLFEDARIPRGEEGPDRHGEGVAGEPGVPGSSDGNAYGDWAEACEGKGGREAAQGERGAVPVPVRQGK